MVQRDPRIHTILYFGPFDQNFRDLTPDTTTYRGRDGVKKDAEAPEEKVNGLKFRYMQRPAEEFLAVGVEGIVLRSPILLIPERHTDGKGFAHAPYFGDDSAMRLLVDMIVANSEYRDTLGRLVRALGT